MLFAAVACSQNTEQIEKALADGNLKEAEACLKEIDDFDTRCHYGGLLIDEYLSIDKLDKAIYVFDRITGHCSMYSMKFTSSCGSAVYTRKYSEKIYNALLAAGRYEEAWNYHPISYEEENYPGNAPDYFAYMSDVIIYMCNAGEVARAETFIKQKSVWFLKNVDNHKWGKNYPDYSYSIMRGELDKTFNNARNY